MISLLYQPVLSINSSNTVCFKYCFLQTSGNQKDVARLLYLFKTPTYSPFSYFHDSRLCLYQKLPSSGFDMTSDTSETSDDVTF